MALQFETGDAAHALDAFQWTNALLGNLVITGAQITVGTGTREVDVSAGTVVVAGSSHSVSAASPVKTLDAATTHPRKDVLYVDNTGSVAVKKGTEEAFDPTGTTTPVEDTINPSPPDMGGTTGTVLAVALVQTDDTVTVWDRRQIGRVQNKIVEALQNFADGVTFSGYPLGNADVAIDHSDLLGIGASDHHAKYTDEEAQDAVGLNFSTGLTYDDATPAYTLDESVLKDGGAKELDAAELTGASGAAGEFLKSDGSAALWDTVPGADATTEPIYGDGSDGAITRSSNLNENGVIRATDYTLQSGVTATVTSGVLVILATGTIDIAGTIDANGQGASGGAGATSDDGGGANGSNGLFTPNGTGGSGGSSVTGNSGGKGGDGDTNSNILYREMVLTHGLPLPDIDSTPAGAGGGGGGAGRTGGAASSGNNGSSPGGAGAGGQDTNASTFGNGGDGGAGGGVVILIGETVTISGTITADGAAGANGGDAEVGGGGGGGGSGGVVVIVSPDLTESTPTYSTAAGAGGAAGSGSLNNADGGAGASGAAGVLQKVQP